MTVTSTSPLSKGHSNPPSQIRAVEVICLPSGGLLWCVWYKCTIVFCSSFVGPYSGLFIGKRKNMGLIVEGASSRLFHFLNGCHLLRMLRRGSMRTCAPESYVSSVGRRFIDGAGVRYMSFTRNKNAGEGYPLLKYGGVGDGDDKFICRVELDGDYLSSHNLRRSDGRRRGGYEDVRVATVNNKKKLYLCKVNTIFSGKFYGRRSAERRKKK